MTSSIYRWSLDRDDFCPPLNRHGLVFASVFKKAAEHLLIFFFAENEKKIK